MESKKIYEYELPLCWVFIETDFWMHASENLYIIYEIKFEKWSNLLQLCLKVETFQENGFIWESD